jgi:hypothetical protein
LDVKDKDQVRVEDKKVDEKKKDGEMDRTVEEEEEESGTRRVQE